MALKIIINHYHHSVNDNLIIKKLNEMAEKDAEILAIVSDIKASTSNIADDISRLANSVEQGNVSDSVIAELRSAATALKAVADITPEPPVVEPPVTEPPVENPPVDNPPVDENGNPI